MRLSRCCSGWSTATNVIGKIHAVNLFSFRQCLGVPATSDALHVLEAAPLPNRCQRVHCHCRCCWLRFRAYPYGGCIFSRPLVNDRLYGMPMSIVWSCFWISGCISLGPVRILEFQPLSVTKYHQCIVGQYLPLPLYPIGWPTVISNHSTHGPNRAATASVGALGRYFCRKRNPGGRMRGMGQKKGSKPGKRTVLIGYGLIHKNQKMAVHAFSSDFQSFIPMAALSLWDFHASCPSVKPPSFQ